MITKGTYRFSKRFMMKYVLNVKKNSPVWVSIFRKSPLYAWLVNQRR